MDLFAQFMELPYAKENTNYTAIPLSTQRKDFLAKDINGAPVFLLHDSGKAEYVPGIQFKHVSTQFHATCHVNTDGTDFQSQFALVVCDSAVPDLYELFIRCFTAAIDELPVNSGTTELSACIQKLLSLFRTLSQPSGKEVSGLWGELYVILNSGNIERALSAWHEDPFDRVDFSWEQGRLEVKSSTQTVRLHQFSLEQLSDSQENTGYVASILLQPLSNGLGIIDIANLIEKKVQNFPILRRKLWSNLTKALGHDFTDKLDKKFDAFYAERCFAVYAMGDIPKPNKPEDPRVMGIRFTADLTTVVSSIEGASLASLRAIF